MILASASPRRKELLALAGFDFTIETASVEETYDPALPPEEIVMHLAAVKSAPVAERHPDELVIGADTVVVLDEAILGKPHSTQEAMAMLRLLSGRTHQVYTGVCLRKGETTVCFHECTLVRFKVLTEEEIAAYVATGEPMDKAGSYGIQGKGCLLVEGIQGDYFNVIGLPVSHLYDEIKKLGDDI